MDKEEAKNVCNTINNINGTCAGNITKIENKISQVCNYYDQGKNLRDSYDSIKEQLENEKSGWYSVRTEYGESQQNFATPAIEDGSTTHDGNQCCEVVKKCNELVDSLTSIWNEAMAAAECFQMGFFKVDIDPIINAWENAITKINSLISKGNNLIQKLEAFQQGNYDDLIDDSKSELDNLVSEYFAAAKTLNDMLKTLAKNEIATARASLDQEKEAEQENYEDVIDLSEIYSDHINCHCNEVDVSFYDDPRDYTDKGEVSEGAEANKIPAYEGYSFETHHGQSAPGPIFVNENVIFIGWDDFTTDQKINAPLPVYGSWKIKPIVQVEIEGEDEPRVLDIGTFDMFAEPREDATNAVNALVDQLNGKDTRSEENEDDYVLDSSPDDYCVTAENFTLKYKVKKNSSSDECDLTFYLNPYKYTDATTASEGKTFTIKWH